MALNISNTKFLEPPLCFSDKIEPAISQPLLRLIDKIRSHVISNFCPLYPKVRDLARTFVVTRRLFLKTQNSDIEFDNIA